VTTLVVGTMVRACLVACFATVLHSHFAHRTFSSVIHSFLFRRKFAANGTTLNPGTLPSNAYPRIMNHDDTTDRSLILIIIIIIVPIAQFSPKLKFLSESLLENDIVVIIMEIFVQF
jgi:hypothetical protein